MSPEHAIRSYTGKRLALKSIGAIYIIIIIIIIIIILFIIIIIYYYYYYHFIVFLLVFGTNEGMGLDCQNFLRTLANKLSTKDNKPYASVFSWLRIQLSFAILRTVHRCIRGSSEVSEDFTFAVAGLHLHS